MLEYEEQRKEQDNLSIKAALTTAIMKAMQITDRYFGIKILIRLTTKISTAYLIANATLNMD